MNENNRSQKYLEFFVDNILPLSGIRRFNLYKAVFPQNDMEHSFSVAILTMLLFEDINANKEIPANIKIGKDKEYADLITLALLHDIEESIISDIPAPIKIKLNEKLLKEIGMEKIYIKMKNIVSNNLGTVLNILKTPRKAISGYKKNLLELVKLADMMDVVAYLANEYIISKNKIYISISEKQKEFIINNKYYKYSNFAKEFLNYYMEKFDDRPKSPSKPYNEFKGSFLLNPEVKEEYE